MGIVAFCPNGHRIKVKDELAGKKGICPTCAERFRIPRKDARPASHPAADSLPIAREIPLDARAVAALPVAVPFDQPAAAAPAQPEPDAVEIVPDFMPLDDEPGAVPAAEHPLLEERPDLVWCFAVRGGAPSAPLDAASFRAWLESGAATSEHVVWRADWPEWRPVGDVFPGALGAGPAAWP